MMRARVVLINPPVPDNKNWVREGRCQQIDIWGAPFPPLSLALISGNLVRQGIVTAIFDCGPESLNREAAFEKIKSFSPQIAVISTSTPTIDSDLNWFTSGLKSLLPELKVILIGIHAGTLSGEILEKYPFIDYIVSGEPEWTILRLVNCILDHSDMRDIKGLTYRSDTGITINPEIDFEQNIDTVGLPDWGKVNMDVYRLPIVDRPFSLINYSRGCPYQCNFCVSYKYYGRKFRKRSIPSLIEEIHYNLSIGIRDFLFWSEQMTFDKEHLHHFLDEIITTGLNQKIRWVCNSRVDGIDRILIKKMKEAGCWQIAFGFESGNQDILKSMNKGNHQTIAQSVEAAELAASCGIVVDGHFIIGYPGETIETVRETIRIACNMPLAFAHFYSATPFPGSALFSEELTTKNDFYWEKINQNNALLDTGDLCSTEINKMIKKAYMRFYLRISVWKRIISIPENIREYLNVLKLGFRFLRSL